MPVSPWTQANAKKFMQRRNLGCPWIHTCLPTITPGFPQAHRWKAGVTPQPRRRVTGREKNGYSYPLEGNDGRQVRCASARRPRGEWSLRCGSGNAKGCFALVDAEYQSVMPSTKATPETVGSVACRPPDLCHRLYHESRVVSSAVCPRGPRTASPTTGSIDEGHKTTGRTGD